MTIEQAINIIENEIRCVQRATTNCCDRDCGKCPLVMDDTAIIKAYGMAIQALQDIDQIKGIINAPVYIQEDVMRYKMICEVVK